MALGRSVLDAVLLEGRSPTELARTHGISRSRIYQLVARFREGGYEALDARSLRPRSCPRAIASEVQDAIVRLRRELADVGQTVTRPYTPSTRASRPAPPRHRHRSTTAFATIASTSPAGSPSATSAASTTSALAAPTNTSPSPS